MLNLGGNLVVVKKSGWAKFIHNKTKYEIGWITIIWTFQKVYH